MIIIDKLIYIYILDNYEIQLILTFIGGINTNPTDIPTLLVVFLKEQIDITTIPSGINTILYWIYQQF